MYDNLKICVTLHNYLTNWFCSNIGVRQGDTLSPTLFNLFVNDLATEIKTLECGVKIGNKSVSILLYAEDIVLISESEESLQKNARLCSPLVSEMALKHKLFKNTDCAFQKKIRVGN